MLFYKREASEERIAFPEYNDHLLIPIESENAALETAQARKDEEYVTLRLNGY